MQLRRRPIAVAGVVLAAAAALSSCSATGLDAATNRNTPVVTGGENREGEVKVLNAVIVSAAGSDTGTFVATFVNDSVDTPVTVKGLTGDLGVKAGDFDPVEVPARGLANLADGGGIPVTGTFTAGDFVAVSIDLDNGSSLTVDAPVVPDSGYRTGLDITPAS